MGAGAGIPVPLTGPDDQALDSAEAWRQEMPAATFAACNTRAVAIVDAYLRS